MLLLQAAATVAAIQPRRAVALVGAVTLGLAAALAGISGFFDGQLGRSDLDGWHVAAQAGYVLVAWTTVGVAGVRCFGLRRRGRITVTS
jgi:hypothetical protein